MEKSIITPCRTCGKDVSKSAKTCPRCGEKKPAVTAAQVKLNKKLIIGFAVLFATLAVIINAGQSDPKTAGDLSNLAYIHCQNHVKNRLKSPASADFPLLPDYAERMKNSAYIIQGYVDSQNGFGAMVRSNFTCGIKFTGGDPARASDWELASLTFE